MEDNRRTLISSSSVRITPLCLLREAIKEAEMYLTKAQSLVDQGTKCGTKKFAKMSRRADEMLNKIRVGKNLVRRYKIQCCARARAGEKALNAARKKKSKSVAAALAGKNPVQHIRKERAPVVAAVSLSADVPTTFEHMYCVQFWVCGRQEGVSPEWQLWDVVWWNRLPDLVLEWKAMRGLNERWLLRIEEYDVVCREGYERRSSVSCENLSSRRFQAARLVKIRMQSFVAPFRSGRVARVF